MLPTTITKSLSFSMESQNLVIYITSNVSNLNLTVVVLVMEFVNSYPACLVSPVPLLSFVS